MLKKLIEKITGKPRYIPQIKWFGGGLTYFLFRIPEFLFGREVGIRPESSAFPYMKDGKQYIEYHFFTKEALIVHTEWVFRNYLKQVYKDTILKLKYFYWKIDFVIPQLINIFDISPRFAIVGYGGIPAQGQNPKGYMFAIAFDTFQDGATNTGAVTWSHTVTGSNPLIAIGAGIFANSGTGLGSATYNGSSATEAIKGTLRTNTGYLYIWFQGSASTGAHNAVVTPTDSSDQPFTYSSSYSGAQAGSTADATGTNNSGSGNASVTVTTVADNCWVVGNWRNSGTSSSAGSGTTVRGTSGNASNSMGLCDNGSAKTPAGAVTLNVNGTAQWGMVGASFSPLTSASYTVTATQQSYTLTGQSSLLTHGAKLVSAFGSFALTGQTVRLALGKTISMIYGSFALTGQNISYFLGKLLTATYGSFTVTGQDANLKIMISLIASQASYVVTGISANLNAAIRYTWTLTANTGSFVLTGIQALLRLRGWIFETKKTNTWDIEDIN